MQHSSNEFNHIVPAMMPAQRILIVEGDAPSALVTSTILTLLGYSYDIVSSGEAALEAVKLKHYSAILMDIRLEGMDRLKTTHWIRAYERTQDLDPVRIIAVTVESSIEMRHKCMKATMNAFLNKPFQPEELRKKIADTMPLAAH